MKCKFHFRFPRLNHPVISKRFIDYAYNDKHKYINGFIIDLKLIEIFTKILLDQSQISITKGEEISFQGSIFDNDKAVTKVISNGTR